MRTTHEILVTAKSAVTEIRNYTTEQIDQALTAMAAALIANTDAILAANTEDLEAARGRISDVMLDRLRLDAARVQGMATGILDVASLPSPLHRELAGFARPNGMVVRKISSAMGVIAIIYESRPNVTSDAAALAIKAGFDGIDIKSCHGYLLQELLSAFARGGKYGGAFENSKLYCALYGAEG